MENPFKLKIPGKKALLDPAQMRTQAIAREAKERFEKISQKLLDIVVEEKVTVVELPIIVGMMTGKVNFHIDGAEIEQILKLGKKDD